MLEIGAGQRVVESLRPGSECGQITRIADPCQHPGRGPGHLAVVGTNELPEPCQGPAMPPARQCRRRHDVQFGRIRMRQRPPEPGGIADLPDLEQALARVDMSIRVGLRQDLRQDGYIRQVSGADQLASEPAEPLIVGLVLHPGREGRPHLLAVAFARQGLGGVHRGPELIRGERPSEHGHASLARCPVEVQPIGTRRAGGDQQQAAREHDANRPPHHDVLSHVEASHLAPIAKMARTDIPLRNPNHAPSAFPAKPSTGG